MREKLIELINNAERSMWGKSLGGVKAQREYLAEYLLDSGVVKVVRCKDCKYFVASQCCRSYVKSYHSANDYCSDGERKDDNESISSV